MNMQDIRSIAKEKGLKTGKMTKIDLVRTIQSEEGNIACFATDVEGVCDQLGCSWRDDCFTLAKKQAS